MSSVQTRQSILAQPGPARDCSSWGLSILIPTFSESESLPKLLPKLKESLAQAPWNWEIIVVDDDSPDGTAERASLLAEELRLPLRVLRRQEKPRCLSGSVLYAARTALFPVVAVLDADLSHDPRHLPELADLVLRGEADVAVGSRYCARGKLEGWPVKRRLLSCLGTWLARRLTSVRDPLSGYFACQKALLDGSLFDLRPQGYKVLLEVLGCSAGLNVRELPILFCDREAGRSKLGGRQVIQFAFQICRLLAWRIRFLARVPVVQAHQVKYKYKEVRP